MIMIMKVACIVCALPCLKLGIEYYNITMCICKMINCLWLAIKKLNSPMQILLIFFRLSTFLCIHKINGCALYFSLSDLSSVHIILLIHSKRQSEMNQYRRYFMLFINKDKINFKYKLKWFLHDDPKSNIERVIYILNLWREMFTLTLTFHPKRKWYLLWVILWDKV